MTSSLSHIKRSQKESLLFREISQLFLQATLDDPRLEGLFVNRVQLSPDKGLCTVFFYTPQGEEAFKEKRSILTLYKPSLRKALATSIRSRYTPNLSFKFDTQFEKHQRLEELIEQVKEKG